jgi:GH15 family glucan-1,4-alpha-glucosidase
MNLVGKHESAARFHNWAATVVNERAIVVQQAIAKAQHNELLTSVDYLHTRYSADGSEVIGEEWPNFQMDGFGTWLWALGEHLTLTGKPLSGALERAAGMVADYLTALWQHPCYDCWEEYPDKIHPHTLAAIYGGLKAHSRFTGNDHHETIQAIETFVRKWGETEGHFVKYIGSNMVDASLLGLATPYRLVEPDDPLMLTTVSRIEQSLAQSGGVHRYTSDSYYGGGEWVLLTGWLGWYYTEIGNYDQAKAMLELMEKQAGVNGCLPEQVPANLNDPNNYEPWVKRWGPIAKPLLWSHAMYLLLHHRLSL